MGQTASCARIGFASALTALIALAPATSSAVEQITLRRDDGDLHVEGRVLVTAADGGLLLETPAGALVTIEPADLLRRTSDVRSSGASIPSVRRATGTSSTACARTGR